MELISSLAPKAAPCGGGLRPQARCQGATTNKSNITGIELASVLVLALVCRFALVPVLVLIHLPVLVPVIVPILVLVFLLVLVLVRVPLGVVVVVVIFLVLVVVVVAGVVVL